MNALTLVFAALWNLHNKHFRHGEIENYNQLN